VDTAAELAAAAALGMAMAETGGPQAAVVVVVSCRALVGMLAALIAQVAPQAMRAKEVQVTTLAAVVAGAQTAVTHKMRLAVQVVQLSVALVTL